MKLYFNNEFYYDFSKQIALDYYCIKKNISLHKVAITMNIPYTTLKRKYDKNFIDSYKYLDDIINFYKIDYEFDFKLINEYSCEYYRNFNFFNEKYIVKNLLEVKGCIISNLFNKCIYNLVVNDVSNFKINLDILRRFKKYFSKLHKELFECLLNELFIIQNREIINFESNYFYDYSLFINIKSLFNLKKYNSCLLSINKLNVIYLEKCNLNGIKKLFEYRIRCYYYLDEYNICISLLNDYKYNLSIDIYKYLGYCYIKLNKLAEAKKLFIRLKDELFINYVLYLEEKNKFYINTGCKNFVEYLKKVKKYEEIKALKFEILI